MWGGGGGGVEKSRKLFSLYVQGRDCSHGPKKNLRATTMLIDLSADTIITILPV